MLQTFVVKDMRLLEMQPNLSPDQYRRLPELPLPPRVPLLTRLLLLYRLSLSCHGDKQTGGKNNYLLTIIL
jgi:hypothetical protein